VSPNYAATPTDSVAYYATGCITIQKFSRPISQSLGYERDATGEFTGS